MSYSLIFKSLKSLKMKRIFLYMGLLGLGLSMGCTAEPTESAPMEPADSTATLQSPEEQMPSFAGGQQAMTDWLVENLQYPEPARAQGVEGKVMVEFVVEADGSVSQAKLLESVSPELDAEALRVVQAMPAWTPSKKNGQSVAARLVLPVQFSLGA